MNKCRSWIQPPGESRNVGCAFSPRGFGSNLTDRGYELHKAKHNDVSAAANAFFDGEDVSKEEAASQWDDGLFGAGKEFAPDDRGKQTFRSLGTGGAPTRANSPVDSTRLNLAPASQQQEDDDMMTAMTMSQLASFQQQETGVVGRTGEEVKFGPATREHYDSMQWAMVPMDLSSASEIIPDAEVEQRLHAPGEPRFLKPLPNAEYIPNFLTICHEISGAREALLLRDHVVPDYGQDADWWKGTPIVRPRIVSADDEFSTQSDRQEDVLVEVQRITAFLENSARSYGSAGALMHTDVMKSADVGTTHSRTALEAFIQNWILAARPKLQDADGDEHLFTTTINVGTADDMQTTDMNLINMPVAIVGDGRVELSEVLDRLLWDTPGGDALSSNHIVHPADILVMRLEQTDSSSTKLGVDVPPMFFVDKYLAENVEATRETRIEMAKTKQRITKIEQIEQKLRTWTSPTKGKSWDAGLMLQYTLGHFSRTIQPGIEQSDESGDTTPMAIDGEVGKSHYQATAQKLQRIIASIEEKLGILAQEKETARKFLVEISRAPPGGLTEADLKYRYILRGVATKPNITYVLRPVDEEHETDEMEDDDDHTFAGMQWWRMEYEVSASGHTAHVTKTKAPDYDVIRAVELEHTSALLVYAIDHANDLSYDGRPLPPPLQTFVDTDNAYLSAELDMARSQPPAYNVMLDQEPRQSIERTSLDSTRADPGDISPAASPPAYGDDLVRPHPEFGMSPDLKREFHRSSASEGEVHEIKLSPPQEGEEVTEVTEMVEIDRRPLFEGRWRPGQDVETGEGERAEGHSST